jgi:predicted  nucleic acid-binding Zn-ribbon protein
VNEVEELRALMDADRWIDRVSSQRSHLPEIAELTAVEAELRSLVKALGEAQSAQEPVRTAYEQARDEAARLATRASDLEAKLNSSMAHARDLSAIQQELTHVLELVATVEDRELNLLVELEPLNQLVNDIKQQAQPAAARRQELQGLIGELQATLDEEILALRGDRAARAQALSPALLARYDHALARSGVSGAAHVDQGRCDGCRIALAPLDVDRWKALVDTFMDCPECGRLLLP